MSTARKFLGGIWSSRNLYLFFTPIFLLLLIGAPATPVQAALAAFFLFSAFWLWLHSVRLLNHVEVQRAHTPRVFVGERIDIALTLANTGRTSPQMVLIEDQFQAGIEIMERHLVTELRAGWQVELNYTRVAERHRGLYLLGPLRLFAADPLGVFIRTRQIDLITRLTVYPSSTALPDYTIPGPHAATGPSLDAQSRVGLGDEILGVREYVRGDSPSRIHWRTSARRGEWHVTQRNRTLHAELAVFLDLTRLSRYGLGRDSTTEAAIEAATSILTRGQEARHRLSLSIARDVTTHYPGGAGLPQLHLLLDRLAVIEPHGEADFWQDCAARAVQLPRGSRAVFIQCTNRVPPAQALLLFKQLIAEEVQVDLVLIDDSEYIRIYREQEVGHRRADTAPRLAEFLAGTGARVTILTKLAPRLPPDFS